MAARIEIFIQRPALIAGIVDHPAVQVQTGIAVVLAELKDRVRDLTVLHVLGTVFLWKRRERCHYCQVGTFLL